MTSHRGMAKLALKSRALGLAACLMFGGCLFVGTPPATIPTEYLPAPAGAAKQLVVLLPGRGDDLRALRRSGMAGTIQQRLPDADVALVELTLAYYMEGHSMQRLHDQVIAPALRRYRRVYLAGASMGGMGVLMYERTYPDELTGLILMAPYMGSASLVEEINAAGGLVRWEPGPEPTALNRNNVGREEWRVVQSWLADGRRTRNVWLVCGQGDRLHAMAQMIAPALPPGHYFEPEGGHAWVVWKQGAQEVFDRIAAAPTD